jgi:translation initiation factor eIF-2B subunit gamma
LTSCIDIYLISPAESKPALEAALARNPHLTSLPHPRPTILAPEGLTNATKTCQLFKFKEVRDVITSDFIVLPCDLVCELDGTALLHEWMVQEGGFGGATGGTDEDTGWSVKLGPGGEKIGRRGGLSVWYETKGKDAVEDEETDFMATVTVSESSVSPRKSSIRKDVSRLVLSMPTDSLREVIEEKKRLAVRHALLRKFGQVKMRTTLRDAHIYFFPHWILDLMAVEDFDTIGEDVLGWWSKATWQKGLGEKLGLRDILDPTPKQSDDDMLSSMVTLMDKDIGVEAYRSTRSSAPSEPAISIASQLHVSPSSKATNTTLNLVIPPILAYIHPSVPSAPIIRRIDSADLLSSVSLRLALLPASSSLAKGTKPSPFAHPLKIAHPASLSPTARVEADNCLLAENVTVGEKCQIKESVVGAGCTIAANVRLTKCVLMEGVTIGENVVLLRCVLGPRCKIEGGGAEDEINTEMTNCEVQGGFVVPESSKSSQSCSFRRLTCQQCMPRTSSSCTRSLQGSRVLKARRKMLKSRKPKYLMIQPWRSVCPR